MNIRIPTPRLLPVTIGMLALVLIAKSFVLVRAAVAPGLPATLIGTARAGVAEAHEAKPAKPEHHAEKKPAAHEPPKTEEKPPVPEGPPPVSDAEKIVLLELRERRKELEARESALNTRESVAAAAERKLSARVDELQGLQKQLETLETKSGQREEAAWQGLVKVYETMKPREAAAIFNDLAMPVLISVLDRMKETKAAAVLAAMAPDRARDVTTQLALTRTRAAGQTEPGPKPARATGG